MSDRSQSLSALHAHLGRLLMHLASNTYQTLPLCILEMVQNAVDPDPDNIHVVIDLSTQQVWVRDDGDGITVAQFDAKLAEVGLSHKTRDKVGRWGLGVISPLNKCRKFTFTSIRNGSRRTNGPTPRNPPRGVYTTWTFVGDEIYQQKSPEIPRHERHDLVPAARSRSKRRDYQTAVPWITEMHLQDLNLDRGMLGNITFERMREMILHKFGKALAQQDVSLHLQFTDADGNMQDEVLRPADFRGRRLDSHVVVTDSGQVNFQLYLVSDPKQYSPGNIHFYEWNPVDNRIYPTPVTIIEMLFQASDDIRPEIRTALRSGVFEGEVMVSGAKQAANRQAFVYDETFFDLMIAIETWWEEVGKKYWSEIQEISDSTRWGRLGRRALRSIEQLLEDEQFLHLRSLVAELVPVGTIGRGHTRPKPKNVVGQDERPSTRADRGGVDQTREPHEGDQPERSDGKGKSVDDMPNTVSGGPSEGRGRKRRQVKGESGIYLDHDEVSTSSQLIHVDWSTLHITLNTRSPSFTACDQNDRWLQHLQEWVVIEVLYILPHDPERRTWLLDLLNERVAANVAVIQGDQRRRMKKERRRSAS